MSTQIKPSDSNNNTTLQNINNLQASPIDDQELKSFLDKYSIEDIVGLKLSRFLEQLGSFEPENFHQMIMSRVEKPMLKQILQRVGGNQVHASRILGINRNTLRKKIKFHNINWSRLIRTVFRSI